MKLAVTLRTRPVTESAAIEPPKPRVNAVELQRAAQHHLAALCYLRPMQHAVILIAPTVQTAAAPPTSGST